VASLVIPSRFCGDSGHCGDREDTSAADLKFLNPCGKLCKELQIEKRR